MILPVSRKLEQSQTWLSLPDRHFRSQSALKRCARAGAGSSPPRRRAGTRIRGKCRSARGRASRAGFSPGPRSWPGSRDRWRFHPQDECRPCRRYGFQSEPRRRVPRLQPKKTRRKPPRFSLLRGRRARLRSGRCALFRRAVTQGRAQAGFILMGQGRPDHRASPCRAAHQAPCPA